MNLSLYLRRRRKIFISLTDNPKSNENLAALLKNIHSLGFTLSVEAQEQVSRLSTEQLWIFYPELVHELEKLSSAHVEWKPFYPNFPAQVMETSEAELYLNALLHYMTNLCPDYQKGERPKFDEQVSLKAIDWGSVEDFESIFAALVSSKTSISATDKDDLCWFVDHYKEDIQRLLPETIPSRENLAVLGAALLKSTSFGREWITSKVTTATDVLRLAVAMHDGDVSLAGYSPALKKERAKEKEVREKQLSWYVENAATSPVWAEWLKQHCESIEANEKAEKEKLKLGKFSRSERRFLLQLLEDCPNAKEDMLRWQSLWVRLGERLHPGEWADRFPNAFSGFEVVRDNTEFQTFNAQIEQSLLQPGSKKSLELLQRRPGDFARRLDHLLRLFPDEIEAILGAFEKVADQVSTPVLLQLYTHFKHRDQPHDLRIFFPKGQVAKVWGQSETLESMNSEVCQRVVNHLTKVLIGRFALLPPLGKCFIDPNLKNYLAPFSQRSASKALRTVARGSRLNLPSANTLRFFLWWRNGKDRTDIDLSAVIYDGNFIYKDVLSYYSLANYGGHHSGDIVDAPEGAAEFIDLDCSKLLEMGARYVVMSVNSYTTQPYCDLPECFAGWMAREKPGSGEIFEAASVQDRFDLSSETQICLPLVVDLETRTAVWMDLALKESPSWNNVQNNLGGVSLMLRAMLALEKTTLFDLFSLHTAARGTWVEDKAEADQIFSVDEGVTPFELDLIGSQWM